MGTQVVELTGDEASLLRSLQKVIDKQMELERKLRDAAGAGDAAGTQIEAAMAKIQAEADKSLRGFLGDLRTLGPEGAAAAEAMKGHFIETGKAGHQSMETIIEQIRKLDPEAAAAAEQAASAIKQEMSRAAQYSEGEFAQVLNELRAMGPEGKQAADQIRKELVAAGKIAERSLEDVAKGLENIDPQAAAAARQVIARMRTVQTDTALIFEDMGVKLATYVGSIGAAATAVEGIKRMWAQVREEQKQAVASLVATEDPNRKLLQVSDTAEQFNQRREQVNTLATQFGVSREQVSQVIFDSINLGFEESVPEIVRASQVVAPEVASAGGGKLKTMFDDQGITATQSISALIVAAKASEVDVENLAKVSATAAEGGRQMGISMQENLAALAVMSAEFASPETAADRQKTFASRVAMFRQEDPKLTQDIAQKDQEIASLRSAIEEEQRSGGAVSTVKTDRLKNLETDRANLEERRAITERLQGKGLADSITEIQQMTEMQQKQFLGDSQEVRAYFAAAVKRVQSIRDVTAEVDKDLKATAEGGGALQEKVRIAEADPQFQALRRRRMAQEKLEVAQAETTGIQGAVADAAIANTRTNLIQDDIFTRTVGDQLGMTEMVAGSFASAGRDEEFTTRATTAAVRSATDLRTIGASLLTQGFAPMVGAAISQPPNADQQLLLEEQRRQTALLERQNQLLEEQARRQPAPPPPPPSVAPQLSGQQP